MIVQGVHKIQGQYDVSDKKWQLLLFVTWGKKCVGNQVVIGEISVW